MKNKFSISVTLC